MTSDPTSLKGHTSVARLEMEAFAKRLHKLMQDKRLSQSDLARRIWGSTEDQRGYPVAKNRDRISQYLRGKGYPTPENLEKLATALNVEPEELAPEMTAGQIDRDNPEILMTAVPGRHGDVVHLVVNKLVPLETAAKVIALLSAAGNVG